MGAGCVESSGVSVIGFGDEILGTGLARGAHARGKRVAFGDGKSIIHGYWTEQIFRNNPNIAFPGDEGSPDLIWIAHHKGNRLYNKQSGSRWIWNYSFRAQPGELFFDTTERKAGQRYGSGFIVIEPNVPWHKTVAPNKDWGARKYQETASRLIRAGHRVVQFNYGGKMLNGVEQLKTASFRDALSILANAKLAICPEGGLHHGAAAVDIPAIVLFGGFIPPKVTGYVTHTNLAAGDIACGSINRCGHCVEAMRSISIERVLEAAQRYLMPAQVAAE